MYVCFVFLIPELDIAPLIMNMSQQKVIHNFSSGCLKKNKESKKKKNGCMRHDLIIFLGTDKCHYARLIGLTEKGGF